MLLKICQFGLRSLSALGMQPLWRQFLSQVRMASLDVSWIKQSNEMASVYGEKCRNQMDFSNSSVSFFHAEGIFLNGIARRDRKSPGLSFPACQSTLK